MLNILNEFMVYGIKFVAMCLCAYLGILAGKALYNKKKAKENIELTENQESSN